MTVHKLPAVVKAMKHARLVLLGARDHDTLHRSHQQRVGHNRGVAVNLYARLQHLVFRARALATAQRLRGLAELADTGKQRRVSLSMQVLPETGLIVPGKLLQIGGDATTGRGLVVAKVEGWKP